jgi:3-hydroxyethyl bacteriochlorophyllide a dehydrogenase
MDAKAVIFEKPGKLAIDTVALAEPASGDLIVQSSWSGISTGTERLLWNGQMPEFPGMGYPLIPGYETVGEVVEANGKSNFKPGDKVFVPGSSGYKDVRGLFGGACSTLVVPQSRVARVDHCSQREGTLIALAATAHHAVTMKGSALPELIIGWGVLGRLMARMVVALGGQPPVIWETNAARRTQKDGFKVIDPSLPNDQLFGTILDASGSSTIIDQAVKSLKPGGEIILGGFYSDRINFAFPPVFMKEARFRVAAEWKPEDMQAVQKLLETGFLSLSKLITHTQPASDAQAAYQTAFEDSNCLKMILDWKGTA